MARDRGLHYGYFDFEYNETLTHNNEGQFNFISILTIDIVDLEGVASSPPLNKCEIK